MIDISAGKTEDVVLICHDCGKVYKHKIRRKFCSPRCLTNDKVRRFRAKKAKEQP